LRDEAFVRSEIRWLIDRAQLALRLPETAVVGCTDEQIARIVDAQQISSLPPPLDELLRYAGVQADSTVLGELVRGSGPGWAGLGWDVMVDAKEHARQTMPLRLARWLEREVVGEESR
jgi:hypothetical protein